MATRRKKIQITVDRALARAWKEASATLRRTKRAGARAWDERWETIAEIVDHDPPLYLAGGHASVEQFLAAHVEESPRTARRMMRVARFASPDDEVRYGVSRLDAAIAYLEAKTGEVFGRLPVAFDKLRIPVEKNGRVRRLPLEKISVRDLRAATRKLVREKKKSHPKASPIVTVVERALTKAGLPGVAIRLRKDQLSLSHIPVAKLPAAARALAAVKLPA